MEKPLRNHSASFQHPLSTHCNSLEVSRQIGRNYVMSAFNADAIEKVKRGLNPPGKEENRHAGRRGGEIIRYDVITL